MRKRIWSILTVLCLCLALVSPRAVAEALSPRSGEGNSVTVNGLVITPADPGVTLVKDKDYAVNSYSSNDYPEGKNTVVTIHKDAPEVIVTGHGWDMFLQVAEGSRVTLRDMTITRTDKCFIPYFNMYAMETSGHVKVEGHNRLECQGKYNWNPLLLVGEKSELYGTGTLEVQNLQKSCPFKGGEYRTVTVAACWGSVRHSIPVAELQGCYWKSGRDAASAVPFQVDSNNELGNTGPYLLLDFNHRLVSKTEPLYQATVDQPVSMDAAALFSGGEGTLTYEAEGLPQELTLSPQGLLTGSFPQAGHLEFSMTAKDTKGRSNKVTLYWQINDSTGPLDVSNGFVMRNGTQIPQIMPGVYRAGQGTITWEPELDQDGKARSGVLTLTDATITGGPDQYMIDIFEDSDILKLHIVLEGKNSLDSTARNSGGIRLRNLSEVYFSGTGTLDVSGNGASLQLYSVENNPDIYFLMKEQGAVRMCDRSGGRAIDSETAEIRLSAPMEDGSESVCFYRPDSSYGSMEYHMPGCDINGSMATFSQHEARIYDPIRNLRLGSVDLLTEEVEGLTYDPTTQELTLDNVRLTQPIYADGSLTLRLVGENAIFTDQPGAGGIDTGWADQEGNRSGVTILGDGHLDVQAVDVAFNSYTLSCYDNVSLNFAFSAAECSWKLGPERAIWYNPENYNAGISLKSTVSNRAWGLTRDHELELSDQNFYYADPNTFTLDIAHREKPDGARPVEYVLAQYDRQGRMVACKEGTFSNVDYLQHSVSTDFTHPEAWRQTFILKYGDKEEPCCKCYTGMVRPPQ